MHGTPGRKFSPSENFVLNGNIIIECVMITARHLVLSLAESSVYMHDCTS